MNNTTTFYMLVDPMHNWDPAQNPTEKTPENPTHT